MEVKRRMAKVCDAVAKFVERYSGTAEGHGDFDAFAKGKRLKGGRICEFRVLVAIVTDDAAQVGAQRGDGDVVANVQGGELFGEGIAIGVGKGPLGKIVGEAFGQEVMAAERLIGVMKDGSVAALLEPGKQFRQSGCRLIADARQMRHGKKLKWHGCGVHSRASLILFSATATSSGLRRRKRACVGRFLPTR